jgi:hypothetical protein
MGGSGGSAGTGGSGVACEGNVCACTEAGIRAAIAEGGGPFTFNCDGPTTVVTDAEIVIDNHVILDGGGTLTVDGNQSHRVFQVSFRKRVELRGFLVTGGTTVNGDEGGGGIYNNDGTLTLTKSTVSGNTAAGGSYHADPPSTRGNGGGIYNRGQGTLTLTKSTVSGNTATPDTSGEFSTSEGGSGGGIYNSGLLTLNDSTVSDNSALTAHHILGGFAGAGGGIYTNEGTMTLTNSEVSGNSGESIGGGIYNHQGTITLTNSTVLDNSTEGDGGGIYNHRGTITLTNSTVSRNNFHGIGNYEGTITLTNSTVSGNSFLGVYNVGGTMTLTNSTVSGEVFVQSVLGSFPSVEMTATVIEGACTENFDARATWTSNGYNIETPGDTCDFNQVSDQVNVSAGYLKLGPLQDNGGPTETHALGAGSVAIDVVAEADCVDASGQPLTEDQRGVARPQGGACDVGAFEREVGP